MKTRLAWSVIAVTCCLIASQPAAAAERRIGVVFGYTSSEVPLAVFATPDYSSVTQPKSRRPGFLAGVLFELKLKDLGAVRFEPKYDQKGGELENTTSANTVALKQTLKLDYVDLPVLYQGLFFRSKPVRPYIMGGLSANFLIQAKLAGQDVKDQFKPFELGLTSAIGFQFNAGRTLVSIDGRLATSLTGIYDNAQKWKNASYQSTATIILPLGK